MTRIGIIGAGQVGAGLARRLHAIGHQILLANSRGPASLAALAQETGTRAAHLHQAIQEAEVLVLAIPFKQNLLLRDALHGSARLPPVIIDTANYIPQRDGGYPDVDAGAPETEWMSRQLGVGLVKTFNSMTADSLRTRGASRRARATGSLCR